MDNLLEELNSQKTNIDTSDVDLFKKTVSELYDKFQTEDQRLIITKFIEDIKFRSSDRLSAEVKDLCLKVKLKDYSDIIPYSYIAKHYFKKSRSWLSQRLNGYDGNGNPMKLTPDEIQILELALKDISKKLGSITLK